MRGFSAVVAIASLGACAETSSQESTPLIEYHRSGGIRGVDDRLVVQSDGSATLTRAGQTTTITLDDGAVDRIQRQLTAAGFADLASGNGAGGRGADMFQYSITYRGHTVRATEIKLPRALRPVVQLLDGILDRNS